MRGTHVQAACPAHEDRAPSLSIDYRPDATKPGTLLHCQAGCEPEDVLSALGLTMSDLYDEAPAKPAGGDRRTRTIRAPRPQTTSQAQAQRKPEQPACPGGEHRHPRWTGTPAKPAAGTTWHPYVTADGTEVGWRVRVECEHDGCTSGREFRWRKTTSSGRIVAGKPADPMPLYRLPELAEQLGTGRAVTVYVCEGESDTDAARVAGALAVTSGPAGSWHEHHTAQIQGVTEALICADRDGGAGRRHAEDVLAQLTAAGIPARMVEALTGKDVRDHLAAGHTLAELRDITAELREQQDEQQHDGCGQDAEAAPSNVRRMPGTAPQGTPAAARRVPSTRSRPEIFAVTDGGADHGLWIDGVRVADLPKVHARMPVRDDAGDIRGFRFLLSGPDGSRQIIGAGDLISGAYVDRLGMFVPADKGIREAAETTTRQMIDGLPLTELAARWQDGRLIMPAREALPRGYLTTAGTEEDARRAWRRIGELACRPNAENLALNIGAAAAAPYIEALSAIRPVSFALVGIGAPRRGKTTNANAAAAWYGSPLHVNPVVSESTIAIGDTLADLGCLPFFRDEAHAAGWTSKQWHDYFMRTLNGAGRRRSSADGSGVVRSTRGWWGAQWWTGNVDVRFGATDGVQARVIALHDPHLPDAATSDTVTQLLAVAYGWPIHWQLADHPTPGAFRELADRARDDLGTVPDGSGSTIAASLAVAIAGAELAGRLIRHPELREAALTAARRVLSTLVDTIADAPVNSGDKLLEDVWTDVQMHPAFYPARADYEAMTHAGEEHPERIATRARDVHGFLWEHDGTDVVSLVRGAFRDLTSDAEYATGEALAELASRGLLVKTAKAGYCHRVKINGRQDRFYTFHAVPEGAEPADGGNDATRPGGNAPTSADCHSERPSDQGGSNSGNGGKGDITAPPYAREVDRQCRRCGEIVDPVADAETGGWHLGCAPQPGECPGCGRHVADSVREAFAGWHPVCAPEEVREAGLRARDAVRGVQDAIPAPEAQPTPPEAPSGTPGATEAAELDEQLADFTRALRRIGREVDEQSARDALRAWHDATSGLRFTGWAGDVGMAAYGRLAARAGLDARGVETIGTLTSPEVDAASSELALHLDWLRDGLELDGGIVTELDVNGQFLSAAGIELGTGEPEIVDKPRSLGVYRGRPGYARLAAPLSIPAGAMPHTATAWSGVDAGRTLALTSVDYLTKRGVTLDVDQVIWWPRSRRHLDAWQRFWRDARTALMTRATAGDEGARLALAVLKSVVTVFLGGLLRSESTATRFHRRDWSDTVIAESWVRALVAVEKAGAQGADVIGMRRDSAWFWTPEGTGPRTPGGLTVSEQLGKWKHSRWAAVDERMRDAYAAGSAETFNSALKAAHEAREGETK